MIRNLPEGSRYVAIRSLDVDQMEQDIKLTAPEKRRIDARLWDFDRRLQATLINAINTNTALTGGPWKDNKPPDFSIVGPIEWDPKRAQKLKGQEKYETGNWDLWDVARALGVSEAMVVHTKSD